MATINYINEYSSTVTDIKYIHRPYIKKIENEIYKLNDWFDNGNLQLQKWDDIVNSFINVYSGSYEQTFNSINYQIKSIKDIDYLRVDGISGNLLGYFLIAEGESSGDKKFFLYKTNDLSNPFQNFISELSSIWTRSSHIQSFPSALSVFRSLPDSSSVIHYYVAINSYDKIATYIYELNSTLDALNGNQVRISNSGYYNKQVIKKTVLNIPYTKIVNDKDDNDNFEITNLINYYKGDSSNDYSLYLEKRFNVFKITKNLNTISSINSNYFEDQHINVDYHPNSDEYVNNYLYKIDNFYVGNKIINKGSVDQGVAYFNNFYYGDVMVRDISIIFVDNNYNLISRFYFDISDIVNNTNMHLNLYIDFIKNKKAPLILGFSETSPSNGKLLTFFDNSIRIYNLNNINVSGTTKIHINEYITKYDLTLNNNEIIIPSGFELSQSGKAVFLVNKEII